MIAFLDKIAARLLQKFPENMEKVAVVLPSKRAVVFLKHYLSQKIDKPIFLPSSIQLKSLQRSFQDCMFWIISPCSLSCIKLI